MRDRSATDRLHMHKAGANDNGNRSSRFITFEVRSP
jgi:hypothetical protein